MCKENGIAVTIRKALYRTGKFSKNAPGMTIPETITSRLMAQKRSCNLAPSDVPGTDEMPGGSMIWPEDSSSETRLPASIQAVQRLTGRERDVLNLLAAGLTNLEISERLYISTHTVAQHVAAMLKRTNCRRRTQLAVLAAHAGILTDGGIGVPPVGQPVGQGAGDVLYGN